MPNILSNELNDSIQRSLREALMRRHEFVTLEHLLYAFTFDRDACKAFMHMDVDVTKLGNSLKKFLDQELVFLEKEKMETPEYTRGFQNAIHAASAHMYSVGKENVSSSSVIAAMFREKESHAVYFLQQEGVKKIDILRYISHGRSSQSNASVDSSEKSDTKDTQTRKTQVKGKEALESFCTSLNQKAKNQQIDPLIGREKEIERTIHILSRRRKNNPILIGDAGVGKTAVVEGLAAAVVQKKVPESLHKKEFFSLDIGDLLAGTRYRGDFEERLKAIIHSVQKRPDAVLFIDEIHSIIGAGSVSGGSLDASNILKPALTNSTISCIGTTTYQEYRNIFEKDHALSRRFQKIEIHEPSSSNCILILKGLKKYYESYHGVYYTSSALQKIVDLSAQYITDRRMPDKAIDLLDEAGAEAKLRTNRTPPKKRRKLEEKGNLDPKAPLKFSQAHPQEAIIQGFGEGIEEDVKEKQEDTSPLISDPSHKNFCVGVNDVESLISRIAQVPMRTIRIREVNRLKELGKELKKKIYGQELAVESLVHSIHAAYAGLRDSNKPIGSFLFCGPTGVGKTELARQLSLELGIEFIRFDMSEYMEKYTVSRLIGSPPGYVGHEQGGQLTDAVYRRPHAVLLLDEIEKAHEDIFNILLQVMDYASLTDSNSRKTNFQNVILILTTNLGASESQQKAIGFGAKEYQDQSLRAIEKSFSPEFRNRLTAVVPFKSLEISHVEKIVERIISELTQRLRDKKIDLVLDSSARKYLSIKGYDPSYGARPVQRLIEKEISRRLSSEILFGRLRRKGTKVKIWVAKEDLEDIEKEGKEFFRTEQKEKGDSLEKIRFMFGDEEQS